MGPLAFTETWKEIYYAFINESIKTNIRGYREAIGFSYEFNPQTDHAMSTNSSLFNLRKAAAIYFWYKNASPIDYSITKYFDEYKNCVDTKHRYFNSNYGVYAYREKGLDKCIEELKTNISSRHAMFCINTNSAMGEYSIDKLCTNTIQFFIRDYALIMVVQMRSSNFLTLLPYDVFMFSVFYAYVYNSLLKKYPGLYIGKVKMQVASLHMYAESFNSVEETEKIDNYIIGDFSDNNCLLNLEKELVKYL